MHIKPSADLRNNYGQISDLAHASGDPIYITKNGIGDVVLMSITAFEEREAELNHRAEILAIEAKRLAGAPTYSLSDVKKHLKENVYG